VRLADGRRFDVTAVQAWDRQLDLALVRIAATNLPALRLGDSDTLKQGRPVVAIGHPLGLDHSIVQGVVSARRPVDGIEMIQLAIPIEPGNSGGPLLDLQGRVHGVLMLKSALSENLGFAMPVNELKRLIERPNPVPMRRWLTIGALNPNKWTPRFGARWSQRAGAILVEGAGEGFGGRSLCLSERAVPERPFELAVRVKLDDESGAAGLVFGSDGGDRHYGFYPTAGQLRLTRFEGPNVFSWSILRTVPSAHYRPGDWNTLKVRWEPERILCYVNGHLVIESNDRGLGPGRVGLAKFRDTRAQFRDFRIGTRLEETPMAETDPALAALAREIDGLDGAPPLALAESLDRHPRAAAGLLAARAGKLEEAARQLRDAAALWHRRAVEAELLRTLEAPDERADLFHAALLVAQLDDPELDPEPYHRQMQEMADEILATLPQDAGRTHRLEALRRFLFEESGFHGSRTDYYHRANSYINRVLDDREGLPITLSIVFLELARRIGLEGVSGLPLPGHFMVRFQPETGEPQILDPFDGGVTITRTEAQERVLAATGEGFDPADLRPARPREIIVRVLRNLFGIAEREDSTPDMLRYLDAILALEPDGVRDRSVRSRLHLRLGNTAAARQDLEWLLERAPPGLDLDRLREVLRSL
ncbi:MAG TPA: tetratricopeptide repeat protein, partial [Methylomirabilota bacterium]|nr:tetratricopeptide repeat protein [Methylomirabilota bacterium]